MSTNNKLSPDYIHELFSLCLKDKEIFEIVKSNLEYSYLPDKNYKTLWKYILNYNNTDSNKGLPSIGILAQTYQTDADIVSILDKIKKIGVVDRQSFLDHFGEFLNRCLFIEFANNSVDLYNRGEREEAYKMAFEFTQKFNKFSVKETFYKTIFKGFKDRWADRQAKLESELVGSIKRVVFGIDEMDARCGLLQPGDTVCLLAQSGKGKSQFLKSIGIANARRGCLVAHFQLEGTEEECTTAYDSAWTGALYQKIETTALTDEEVEKLSKISRKIEGDIILDVAEKFDSLSMSEIDKRIEEMEKIYGKIDVIILDYLEKGSPGDGRKYPATNDGERMRREAIAEKFKNICVKYRAVGFTATQANDIKRELLDNPEFVLTRNHIAEFKALVNSFSFFFTHNMTSTEYDENLARIWVDKLRKRKANFVIRIATAYSSSRYYNKKRTLELFGHYEKTA